MGALRLSSDPTEKQRLKAECRDIMNAADRIKNDVDWRPTAALRQESSQGMNINQWAADLVSAQSPSVGSEYATEQASSLRLGLSSTTATPDNASSSSGKYISFRTSLTSHEGPIRRKGILEKLMHYSDVPLIEPSNNHFPILEEFIPSSTADIRHEDRPQPVSEPIFEKYLPPVAKFSALSEPADALQDQTSTMRDKAHSSSPSKTVYSHVHRLTEPISTRRRAKREDIILLKASMVNGFKCPPWDRNPSPDEFVAIRNTELFTYATTFLYV